MKRCSFVHCSCCCCCCCCWPTENGNIIFESRQPPVVNKCHALPCLLTSSVSAAKTELKEQKTQETPNFAWTLPCLTRYESEKSLCKSLNCQDRRSIRSGGGLGERTQFNAVLFTAFFYRNFEKKRNHKRISNTWSRTLSFSLVFNPSDHTNKVYLKLLLNIFRGKELVKC